MPVKAKAFTADMKAQISDAANALGSIAPSYSQAAGKTYEAWVLFELAARLQFEGVDVTARDHTGDETQVFYVRGGPGFLPGVNETGALPCYFLLKGVSDHLAELHSSLRHRGLSGDTHELDVSVLDADSANEVREDGGGPIDVEQGRPWFSPILLGVELKEYESAVLPKVFPRALLGVAIDLTPPKPVVVLAARRAFVVEPPELSFWLATTSNLGTSAPFLSFHDLGASGNVEPGGTGEGVLDEMAMHVVGRLSSLI